MRISCRKDAQGNINRRFTKDIWSGLQVDYVCVLRGQQGIRKSNLWKILSCGFFNSWMPTALEKDFLMLINREWFYGLEELDQVTKKLLMAN